MSETQAMQVGQEDVRKRQLQDIEAVRDLFARAHDYIAQAQYPGHLGMGVAEVLNFLKFQHNDFKLRSENLKKQLESTVDVAAAQVITAEALAPESTQTQSVATPNE